MKLTGKFNFDAGDFEEKLIAATETDIREKLRSKGIRTVKVKLDRATKKLLFEGPPADVEKARKLFARR